MIKIVNLPLHKHVEVPVFLFGNPPAVFPDGLLGLVTGVTKDPESLHWLSVSRREQVREEFRPARIKKFRRISLSEIRDGSDSVGNQTTVFDDPNPGQLMINHPIYEMFGLKSVVSRHIVFAAFKQTFHATVHGYLCQTINRINKSPLPNVNCAYNEKADAVTVHACRDIKLGEELTCILVSPWIDVLDGKELAVVKKQIYCFCQACDEADDSFVKRQARRDDIKRLWGRIHDTGDSNHEQIVSRMNDSITLFRLMREEGFENTPDMRTM